MRKEQSIGIIFSIIGLLLSTISFAQKGAGGATYVEYTAVKVVDRQEIVDAIGTLLPAASVIIKPEIAGKVQGVYFKEGQAVDKDAVLLKIDDTALKATYDDAHAKYLLAQQNLNRLTAAKAGSSVQQIDIARATFLQATANLEISAAQLAKTELKAPFKGVLGLSDIEEGQYLQVGMSLVTLLNTEKLKLEFSVPERVAHRVKVAQTINFNVDNYPEQDFIAQIYATSPEIDKDGRSLTIRAWVDNELGDLTAGLFVRLRLIMPQTGQVLQLPEEAIFAQNGKQWVYVVKDSPKVAPKAVVNADLKTNPSSNANANKDANIPKNQYAYLTEVILSGRRSGIAEIASGIEAHDIIVKTGQQKLRDGAQIIDVNALKSADTKPNL